MNKVKTYIANSEIQGIGLFAGEFIPKGTVIWELEQPFDKIWYKNAIQDVNEVAKEYLKKYSYCDKNKCCFMGDGAKYSNHANDANTTSTFYTQIANRDIQEGEEITTNYNEIDSEFRNNKKF